MFRRSLDPSRWALAFGLALFPLSLFATPASLAAQAVVQAMPDPAASDLRIALQKLGADPRNLSALLTAGHASLKLDDVDAAEGFFARAQDVAPRDPKVMIGMALVSLRREDALGALRNFQRAEAANGDLSPHAAERGLAFDLAGASSRAQALYKQALARAENDETVRRLALSYAISGDGPASEAMLLPLLQRRDLAAYRTRAFALAILGRDEEAVTIAETMLPARVASRLTPYLRYMPRLTAAQQAAAANLGVFPDAGEIGRDDPALAALGQAAGGSPGSATRPGRAAGPGSRLVPEGAVMGQSAPAQPARSAPSPAPISGDRLARLAPPPAAPQPPAVQPPAAQAPVAAKPAPAAAPVVVAQQADRPPPPKSFVQAFETYGPVDSESLANSAPAKSIAAPPRPKSVSAPVHPARHWVQLGIGRNVSAFAFDWRKRVREAGGLLDGIKAWRVPATGTNRLLAGPFGSADQANEMVTKLKAAGVDALRYTSDEGEEVVPLG